MYHVIIAGGSGSRFWPKSRKTSPKQLLKVIGDETMIKLTFNRLRMISKSDKIFVVASKNLCELMFKELKEVPKENFIIEPTGKNTAPAIGLAALHIFKRDSNAVMGVYSADHLIEGDNEFKTAIQDAKAMVEKKSCLVTVGVNPTYPSTGYGYIQCDMNKKVDINNIFKVKTFAEKPEENTARNFLKSGEFLWNSGIFIWQAKMILLEMKTFMCELHDSLDAIYDAISTKEYDIVLDREWELVRPESIDYGILEKAKNVYTVKASFKWSDIGSWNSLFKALPKNDENNYHEGEVIALDTNNNLIISPNRLTAVIGVQGLSIINLDDATLIVPHNKAEEVKNIVNMLKTLNKVEYL
tara:strand:- start:283 stop:1350 length:1068 start_codon:yes stop_codon:yes gene_type:complete